MKFRLPRAAPGYLARRLKWLNYPLFWRIEGDLGAQAGAEIAVSNSHKAYDVVNRPGGVGFHWLRRQQSWASILCGRLLEPRRWYPSRMPTGNPAATRGATASRRNPSRNSR